MWSGELGKGLYRLLSYVYSVNFAKSLYAIFVYSTFHFFSHI